MGQGGGDIQAPGAAPTEPRHAPGTPDVFISYASPDIAVAEAVCVALEREGVVCWVAPRDVLPGDFYADAIVRAIDASRAIIIVLSKSAVASPHVLREVERAASKRHPVLTLRIDQVPLPAALEYFLNTSQWLDVSSDGLASALPKLLTAVRRVIAGPAAAHASIAAPDGRGTAPVRACSSRKIDRGAAVRGPETRRAEELDPNNLSSKQLRGIDAMARGEPNEAVPVFAALAERDPLDATARAFVGWALFWADRLPEAEAAFRSLLELNPSYAGAHCSLSEVLLSQHNPDAVIVIARQETDEASRLQCTADALWALGQRPEADALLQQAQSKYGNTLAYGIAESYAARGDKDAAFRWLDRALENGEAQPSLMRSDPSLRSLRSDPRFDALLRKMKLL